MASYSPLTKGGFALFYFLILTSLAFAQQTTQVDVNVDGKTDTGILTGSPWLWLLFVVVVIIVIVTLTSRRRN